MNNPKLRVELDPHQEFSAIGFLISKIISKSRKGPIQAQSSPLFHVRWAMWQVSSCTCEIQYQLLFQEHMPNKYCRSKSNLIQVNFRT